MVDNDKMCACTAVLQQILQTGEIDHTYVMNLLLAATHSQNGQFFEVQSGSHLYKCQFSTNSTFIKGKDYTLNELPLEQITVMHKSSPIAIIVIDNQDDYDNWEDIDRQRVMNAICVGIVMAKTKTRRYEFTINVFEQCKSIVSRLSSRVQAFNMGKRLEFIDNALSALSRLLYLASEFLIIDTEQVQVESAVVESHQFFQQMVKEFAGSNVSLRISPKTPNVIIVDRLKLQKILIGVFQALEDKQSIHWNMDVDFADYSSSQGQMYFVTFRLWTNQSNMEKPNRFTIHQLSVDTLELSISKRLCELLSGTYEPTANSLTIKIRVDVPDKP